MRDAVCTKARHNSLTQTAINLRRTQGAQRRDIKGETFVCVFFVTESV